MEQLIYNLFALYGTFKNLHYQAKGLSFYSVHTMADEMNSVLDYVDEIQEKYYLARGEEAANLADVMMYASNRVANGDVETCLRGALVLIDTAMALMGDLQNDLVADVFSRLTNDLVKDKAFILRTLM